MPFNGKATYSGGETMPEIQEDISDLVSIISPHETPLLDILGEAARPARSTVHEWLEDSLSSNLDYISAADGAEITVSTPTRFRIGDQLKLALHGEQLLVTGINVETSTLTVLRAYGGTPLTSGSINEGVTILGNAALEGEDADDARSIARVRASNVTQIFSATVAVSGSELAVRQAGVKDELDYQKTQRTRELLRDLENSVINGASASTTSPGSDSVRRTMRGIRSFITTNHRAVGLQLPSNSTLTEEVLNTTLRQIWNNSTGQVDLILVGGREKRAINKFIDPVRHYTPQSDTFRSMTQVYESDFGACNIVLSRWVPTGTVLLLDSSRIDVLPLSGRSFHYKPLASNGDAERGQVIGEYTVELRNEAAHGMISGLNA